MVVKVKHAQIDTAMQLLARGEVTRDEAGRMLGISARQVSRYMRERGVSFPQSTRYRVDEQIRARRVMRRLCAMNVLRGSLSVAQASQIADVSERTMYRYVARLRRLFDVR